MSPPRPVVFLGPTLPAAEARVVLDADYLPPVELGEVWRVSQERPPAIGIVDGYFHRVPAVWHKEILCALSLGIPVYGSASMGALRGAELAGHGMVAVGDIAADYLEGRLTADDEVAVVHAPGELGYACLSEPLVNIRATLRAAMRDKIVAAEEAQAVLAAAQSLHYGDRSWPRILAAAALAAHQRSALEAWLPRGRVDQKKIDALAMLERMRADGARPPAASPAARPFVETVLWREFVRRETPLPEILEEFLLLDPLPPGLGDAVDRARRGERVPWHDLLRALPAWPAMCRRARCKRLCANADVLPEAVPTGEDLLAWFFGERLGWPEDLPSFLRTRGWTAPEVVAGIAAREARFLASTGDPQDGMTPSPRLPQAV